MEVPVMPVVTLLPLVWTLCGATLQNNLKTALRELSGTLGN
jgi:hypothetical protein